RLLRHRFDAQLVVGPLGFHDKAIDAVAALCRCLCLLHNEQDGIVGGVVLAAGDPPQRSAVWATGWRVECVVHMPLADVVLAALAAVVDFIEVSLQKPSVSGECESAVQCAGSWRAYSGDPERGGIFLVAEKNSACLVPSD